MMVLITYEIIVTPSKRSKIRAVPTAFSSGGTIFWWLIDNARGEHAVLTAVI